jgi:hypothetical protein
MCKDTSPKKTRTQVNTRLNCRFYFLPRHPRNVFFSDSIIKSQRNCYSRYNDCHGMTNARREAFLPSNTQSSHGTTKSYPWRGAGTSGKAKGSGGLPETGASVFSDAATAASPALRSRRLRDLRRFLRLAGVAAPPAATWAVVAAALPCSTASTSAPAAPGAAAAAALPPPPRRRHRRSRRLAGGWSIRIWLPYQAQKRKGLRERERERRRARCLSGRNRTSQKPEGHVGHDALKNLVRETGERKWRDQPCVRFLVRSLACPTVQR